MLHRTPCISGGSENPSLAQWKATRGQGAVRCFAIGSVALLALSLVAPARGQDKAEKKDASPAAATWTILFRSDDPTDWNKDAKGPNGEPIAISLKSVSLKFKYLRLRRMDTREALIVRVTPQELLSEQLPVQEAGFWWNGSSKEEWKGYHLGIAHGPRYKFPAPHDMIAVMNVGWDGFSGSGFGHKCFVNDGQYYCWLGKEIGRTTFEIAVSDGPLSTNEKAVFVGANTKTPPLSTSAAKRSGPAAEVKRSNPPAKVVPASAAAADPSKFSVQTFELIHNGMTEDEVMAVLGTANGSSTRNIASNGQTTITRKLTWRQATPNITITVTLRNGVVSGKNRIEVNPLKK